MVEMSMRERVARALYARNAMRDANCDVDGRQVGEPFDIPWDDLEEWHPDMQAEWLGDADAVLEALREPDEGMLDAGECACVVGKNCVNIDGIFTAMIDHARNDGKE